MYTKKSYSVADMARWTLRDTVLMLSIALVPVIIYQVFDQKWLHLPWLPIAVVGTAVAFIISFQNKRHLRPGLGGEKDLGRHRQHIQSLGHGRE